jgi:hypothetical protein
MPSVISTPPPEQGQLVQVRSRQWVVNEVKPKRIAVVKGPSFLDRLAPMKISELTFS